MNNLYMSNINHTEDRGEKHHHKKSLKDVKRNTVQSLNDVECFLNDFSNFWKYVKLYKILR